MSSIKTRGIPDTTALQQNSLWGNPYLISKLGAKSRLSSIAKVFIMSIVYAIDDMMV
jgi:hypothetical protein